jgi:hypothetical protein
MDQNMQYTKYSGLLLDQLVVALVFRILLYVNQTGVKDLFEIKLQSFGLACQII